MQGNVHTGTSRNLPPSTLWTPEEWQKITAELHARNPGVKYQNFLVCPFNPLELEEAAEAVLPQERHRLIEDFAEVRGYLFDACQRYYADAHMPKSPKFVSKMPPLRAAEPKESKGGYKSVTWKPHEWETVTKELYANFPYLFDDALNAFGAGHFRVAQSALPPDRHRPLKHRKDMAEMLWKTWLDHGERLKNELQEKRQAVQFGKSIVVQPVEKHSDNDNPMALAVHKAFKEPPKEKPPVKVSQKVEKLAPVKEAKAPATPVRPKRIDWDKEDWMKVARALVQLDTVNHYLGNPNPNIPLRDVKKAQGLALPIEKHRPLNANGGLAPKLIPCFDIIRKEREELEKATHIEAAPPVVQHAAYVEKPLPQQEEKITVETPLGAVVVDQQTGESVSLHDFVHRETAAPAPAPTDFVSALAQAAAPVLNVVLERLAGIIAPQVAGALLPEIIKAMPQPVVVPMAPAHIAEPAPSVDYAAIRTIVRSIEATVSAKVESSFQAHLRTMESKLEAQIKAIKPVFVAPTPDVAPSLKESPVAPSMALEEPVKEKAKLPKITLIGPLGAQKADLERAYPQLNLCFIESGKGIREGANNCELFIVNQKNCNSSMRDDVKRYVPKTILETVHGGVSSMKFLIDEWLKNHPQPA